jgi:hypothetical protein
VIDPHLMASIRRRAYEIWEQEGRPEGRARIHWLRAEAEFREKMFGKRPPVLLGARVRLQKRYEPPPPLPRPFAARRPLASDSHRERLALERQIQQD